MADPKKDDQIVAQSFEIATLEPNHVAEIQKLKTKVETVVIENPFVEITDNKSYLKAKDSRKNLREVRIEVEKEEKLIPGILTAFRKRLGKYLIGEGEEKGLNYIAIVPEDIQDEEVKRWEKIKKDEADERDRIAAERKFEFEGLVKVVTDKIQATIDGMAVHTIEADKEKVEQFIKEHSGTFEEYDVLFTSQISAIRKKVSDKEAEIEQSENQRKSVIKNRMTAIERQVQELILGCPFDAIDVTGETITNILTENFDNQEFTSEFEMMSDKMHAQWKKRITELNDQQELELHRAAKRYDTRAERLVEIGMDKLENGDFKVFDLTYKKTDIVKDNDEIFVNTAKSIETFIETEVNKSNITKVDTVVDQLTKGIENSIDSVLENYHEEDVDQSQMTNFEKAIDNASTNAVEVNQPEVIGETAKKIDYVAMVEAKTAGETFPAPTDFATDADFQSEDNIPLGGGNVFHQATESIEEVDEPEMEHQVAEIIGAFTTVGELRRLIDKLDSDAVFVQPMTVTKWVDGYSFAVKIEG